MFLIAVLYAVFAAMTFINSKLMLSNPYPFFVGMLRALGSSVFLLAYSLIFHRKELFSFSIPASSWRDLLVFGVLVHGLVMSGFSYAVQYTDPVKVCFIIATCPFITAILQYLFYKETLTTKKIIGLLIGFCGLIPVLFASDHGAYKNVPEHLETLGSVICFIAIIFFAYGWIAMKRFLNRHSEPIAIVNGIAMLVGSGVSIVLFLIANNFSFPHLTFTPDFSVLVTAFVASSLMTYVIYAYLLKTFSATFIAFAGFLEPVFGLVYGVLFMGHRLTVSSVGGLVILFIGLYLFYREEIKTHTCDLKTDPNC